MPDLGKLHPQLRLLGETLINNLKLKADLKQFTEALRDLENSEREIENLAKKTSQDDRAIC